MADLKILQVVGYKDRGKTTLIRSWIEWLAERDLQAAVIKRHGHGGGLEHPNPASDSMQFYTTGAVSSLAVGDGQIQLHARKCNYSLLELVRLAEWSQPDVVLIEGFKTADYPKVVLVKDADDWSTLCNLTNIVGVIAHEGASLPGVSYIQRNDSGQVNKWLAQWMGGEADEAI